LTNDATIRGRPEDSMKSFRERYPEMSPYHPKDVIERLNEMNYLIEWPTWEHDIKFSTRYERLINVWSAYLMSVPLHRQKEVSLFFFKYFEDRNIVIDWLQGLEEKWPREGKSDGTETVDNDRIREIIKQVRLFAYERQKKNMNRTRDGKILSIPLLIKDNIRNLIMKEEALSFYRLLREKKKLEKTVPQDLKKKVFIPRQQVNMNEDFPEALGAVSVSGKTVDSTSNYKEALRNNSMQ
jgi:hypothetical protein